MIVIRRQITDGMCGIGRIFGFRQIHAERLNDYLENDYVEIGKPLTYKAHNGGTGMFGSGFIDNGVCKEVYATLCKNHKLVFQTPVRYNENSYNQFFYAMWDDAEHDDVEYIEPHWPF